MEAERRIRDEARRLGFDAVGIAAADVPLGEAYDRYLGAVNAGYFADLPYLTANAEVRARLDGEGILPGARSVICVAKRYARAEDESPGLVRHIARYARGRDYHNGLRKKLRRLAAFVRSLGEDVEARPIIDDAPVLERAWAARSGLGFIGKNGLLIIPGQGSFVLLGEVVTTLLLPPGTPIAERCGTCTLCLTACPTDAFPSPFVLDARRCIATLTIERRATPPEPLRGAMGSHVFGCDDCQSVCPFNGTRPAPPESTEAFSPLPRWRDRDLADLLRLTPADFAVETQGSPLFRATWSGLVRSAIVVAANEGRADLGDLLAVLEGNEDESVADLARWAQKRLRGPHET